VIYASQQFFDVDGIASCPINSLAMGRFNRSPALS
jgi:hypothetical protein